MGVINSTYENIRHAADCLRKARSVCPRTRANRHVIEAQEDLRAELVLMEQIATSDHRISEHDSPVALMREAERLLDRCQERSAEIAREIILQALGGLGGTTLPAQRLRVVASDARDLAHELDAARSPSPGNRWLHVKFDPDRELLNKAYCLADTLSAIATDIEHTGLDAELARRCEEGDS